MRWRGQRQSSNIEDRRGSGGGFFRTGGPRVGMGMPRGRTGGGLGIGTIVVILIVGWLLGINPLTLLGLDGGGSSFSPTEQQQVDSGTPDDEGGKFVAAVLASTEDTWTGIFKEGGRTYNVPTLVLFSGQTASACGYASSASGPFYCPNDQKVYIDLAFFRELRDRFRAPGDFAQAYVIAHEVGHHVQDELGILSKVNDQRGRVSQTESNALSVRTELQADCLAGIWAAEADRKGLVEVGDIDEALNAASRIGDDTLQRQTQGRVVPDSFTHGSAAQRSTWFKRGYNEGRLDACDTFSVANI